MADVVDLFLSVIPPHKTSAKGWLTFNCPSCGDQRGRGAFKVTDEGGWRYSCRNGGCEFSDKPTGWDVGGGLGGRARRLYSLLGGRVRDIPLDILFKRESTYNITGQKSTEEQESALYYFEKEPLPEGSVNILEPDIYIDSEQYQQVLNYLVDRSPEFLKLHTFYWSPKFPLFLIIPYIHNSVNVGFLARNITKSSKTRMFQKCHEDYLFNQHILTQDNDWVIVAEGVLDGIATCGVSTRGTSITKKQELLLNICGKDKIVLPDFEADGINLINKAEENGWWVANPQWDRGIKDASQALREYGMLYTIESVRRSAHKNYLKAKANTRLRNN